MEVVNQRPSVILFVSFVDVADLICTLWGVMSQYSDRFMMKICGVRIHLRVLHHIFHLLKVIQRHKNRGVIRVETNQYVHVQALI